MVVRQKVHPFAPTPDNETTVSASVTPVPMVHSEILDEKDSKA